MWTYFLMVLTIKAFKILQINLAKKGKLCPLCYKKINY